MQVGRFGHSRREGILARKDILARSGRQIGTKSVARQIGTGRHIGAQHTYNFINPSYLYRDYDRIMIKPRTHLGVFSQHSMIAVPGSNITHKFVLHIYYLSISNVRHTINYAFNPRLFYQHHIHLCLVFCFIKRMPAGYGERPWCFAITIIDGGFVPTEHLCNVVQCS